MSVEDVAFDLTRAHDKISAAPIDELREQIAELTQARDMADKIREVANWLNAKKKVAEEAGVTAGQSHEGFADGLAALISTVDDTTTNEHALVAWRDTTILERRSDYLQGDVARMPDLCRDAYQALGNVAYALDQIGDISRGMGRDASDQALGRDHALQEIEAYRTDITGTTAA